MSADICPVTLLSALRDGAGRHAEHYGVALTKAPRVEQASILRFMQTVQNANETLTRALLIGEVKGIHGATASLFEVLALESVERMSACCADWAHYAQTGRIEFERLVDSAYIRLYETPCLIDEIQREWREMATNQLAAS